MNIFVKSHPEKDINVKLRVQPNDPIEGLKRQIEEKINIPQEEQQLEFGETVMEGGQVSDFGLKDNCTVLLIRKMDSGMQIFVKSLMGKTVTLNGLKPYDKGIVLKQKIEEREGIKPEEQIVVFAGKTILDDQKLSYYGIGRDSTVHLCLRLPGGVTDFRKVNCVSRSPATVIDV